MRSKLPQNRDFARSEVAEKYAGYSPAMRAKLLQLRELILKTAASTKETGEIVESLKWNEPSYSTINPKTGSPIRINAHRNSDTICAMYFICTTNLVDVFRLKYGSTFRYEGNRAILFDLKQEIPVKELRQCIALALTYHLNKTSKPGKNK